MQTPKTKVSSVEAPQRKSPATPRTARQLKIPGSDADSVSTSPHPASRTPKDRSPKVIQRKSPQSTASSEKKRPSRLSELETQLAQLQDDLKKAKDQLESSESQKRQAQQQVEEANKQLLEVSAKLEESKRQLLELSDSDDARIQELCKISQDRDQAWQSELEAVQKEHLIDSSSLASAMIEIQKLKAQLEMVDESEATQTKHVETTHAEIQSLRKELSETLYLVERLKSEVNNCKESEAQALEDSSQSKWLLETANSTAEMLRLDGSKAVEAYNTLLLELDQSKAQVKSLEAQLSKFQADMDNGRYKTLVEPIGNDKVAQENSENEEINHLKAELNGAKLEVDQLRSALDAAETRYQQEYIQSTLQIRNTYEQVEHTKSEWDHREAELEAELKKAKAVVEDLRVNLMDKETQLQSISEENEALNLKMGQNHLGERESKLAIELKKAELDLAELKSILLEKETELQSINEENKTLKMEIRKTELECDKVNKEAVSLVNAARDAEREALMKLGYLTEEADKSSRRAARVTEQLDAAQAAKAEMEDQLRRLKVQSDQWRKAAEVAASMLSTGNNGKYIEKTGSLDRNYNPVSGKMESPYSDMDDDDDSLKKKNGNMLKKLGSFWKKGH